MSRLHRVPRTEDRHLAVPPELRPDRADPARRVDEVSDEAGHTEGAGGGRLQVVVEPQRFPDHGRPPNRAGAGHRMRIALVALAVVSVASCASPRALADTPKSFVPWQPLPAAHQYVDPATSPPAAPAVPPGTPRCVAAQMEGVGLAGSAAAGNVDTPLLRRNKGTVSCYLRGFVDLTVIDRRGRVLANAAGAVGRGTFF